MKLRHHFARTACASTFAALLLSAPAMADGLITNSTMEADANLVNFGRKPSLEEEFQQLERDEDIEKELAALKARKGQPAGTQV